MASPEYYINKIYCEDNNNTPYHAIQSIVDQVNSFLKLSHVLCCSFWFIAIVVTFDPYIYTDRHMSNNIWTNISSAIINYYDRIK